MVPAPDVGRLELERLDGLVVVRLLGEHDLSSAPYLREILCDLAAQGQSLVADLTETEFLDLAVFRALLAGDEALGDRGRRLALQLKAQSPAYRVLHLTGLQQTFAWAEDRAAALEIARLGGGQEAS